MTDAIMAGVPVDQSELAKLGVPEYRPPADYIQRACEKCSALAWMGPRLVAVKAANPEIRFFCAACAARQGYAQAISLGGP